VSSRPITPPTAGGLSILLVSSYYWPETSGNAPYATGLAEHLAAEGHRVRVMTGFAHYPEWRATDRALHRTEHRGGVEIHRRWHYVPGSQSALTRGVYESTLALSGLTALPRSAPDVILGISPTLAALTVARTASLLYRRPFGAIFQDLQGPGAAQSGVSGGARIASLVASAEVAGARHAAAVGVIAEGFRGYLVAHGVASERIVRVRNWSQGEQPTEPATAARARRGWGDDLFVCLHAGNMGHKQGLENVLHAASQVGDPRIRIVLAGDGNARAGLEQLAAELALDNVEFLPPQPPGDYEAMLRAADVLLVNQRASVGEMSLASKLTSYFAAGRPVVAAIAPRSETARELELARAGVIVDADRPQVLASALEAAAADPERLAELGAGGLAYARAHLTREAVMAEYEAFLEQVLAHAPPVRPGQGRAPAAADGPDERVPPLSPTHDPAVALSCVVVTYRSAGTIEPCLRSLERQRHDLGGELEVIVVDNASDDETVSIVTTRFPWVALVRESSNTGFSHATNRGLAQARGRALLLLNPDTVVPDGTLAATLAALEVHPEAGALGCKLVLPDGTFDHAAKRGLPTLTTALAYVLALHRLHPHGRRTGGYVAGHLDEDETGAVEAINGAFMLVRRAAAAAVGGLDERFWLYGEDLDWCLRLGRAGWRILYWPGVSVMHVKGASGRRGRSTRTNMAFHRSMWQYYAKNIGSDHPAPLRALVLLGIGLRLVGAVSFNALRARAQDARRAADDAGSA
jgi:GT2 family glycosyltransferase/glycosyltransferase involved in cell wall biosynthesis